MKSGFVALIGRPNAGKSTLLNRIVGHKLAIVSDKPQTTRTRVAGAKNFPDGLVVFVDTPGVHKPTHRMDVRMVDVALDAMREVDLVTLVVDVSVKEGPGDRHLLDLVKTIKTPAIAAFNKVDLIAKAKLLPIIDRYRQAHPFVEYVPISALDGTNVTVLENLFLQHLPAGDPLYPDDYVTNQSERFFVAEIIREQVLRVMRDELPFSTAVVIDRFEEEGNLRRIAASIVVERDAHKGMIIGAGGERLKRIGSEARQELETLMDGKVFLELWVKVRSGWADDEEHLRSYGYE